MKNKTTVIIRCKNEERWIGHAIQSVLDFIETPEIIIIDNNSSDDSRLLARLFMRFNDISFVSIDDYTPGKALNLGVRKASYENIVFLSAHCVIRICDMSAITEALDHHAAVFGKHIPMYRGKRITPRYLWSNFGPELRENVFSEVEKRYFLHNGFCAYRKSFLAKHPFDEELPGKEDRYWVNDIVEKGHSFLYDPINMCCDHHWTIDGNTWKGIG